MKTPCITSIAVLTILYLFHRCVGNTLLSLSSSKPRCSGGEAGVREVPPDNGSTSPTTAAYQAINNAASDKWGGSVTPCAAAAAVAQHVSHSSNNKIRCFAWRSVFLNVSSIWVSELISTLPTSWDCGWFCVQGLTFPPKWTWEDCRGSASILITTQMLCVHMKVGFKACCTLCSTCSH